MQKAPPENTENRLAGNPHLLAVAFEEHRPRLRQMLTARMDRQLAARLSQSDVIQDVFLEVRRRIHEFDPTTGPLFVWLRAMTVQRLAQLRRFHVTTEKRSISRECGTRTTDGVSSDSLTRLLVDGQLCSVVKQLERNELAMQVRGELDRLRPLDREIIFLRHFDQLTNEEAAVTLRLNPSTASTRYLRALQNLRRRLQANATLADYLDDWD